MVEGKRVILLGDCCRDSVDQAHQLSLSFRQSPTFVHFLQNTVDTAQSTGVDVRAYFSLDRTPTSIQDPDCAQQIVISSILSLGEIIRLAWQDASLLAPSKQNLSLHAVGLALIPAAALASANSLEHLLSIANELVGVSARLACALRRRSEDIEISSGCWGLILAGLPRSSIQEEISRLHEQLATPRHKQAYLAWEEGDRAAIFGPPSTLDRLLTSSALIASVSRQPCSFSATALHAPHLPALDEDYILGECSLLLTKVHQRFGLRSTSTTLPYDVESLRDLLQSMIRDIGNRALDLPGITHELLDDMIGHNQADLTCIQVDPDHLEYISMQMNERGISANVCRCDDVSKETLSRVDDETHGKIAIVGMAGRFPGSDNIDQFWRSLLAGQKFHKNVPTTRFDLNQELGNDTTQPVPLGCFLDDPGYFDPAFFNLFPREALKMDPNHRLALMTAYEALQSAGISCRPGEEVSNPNVATFVGQCSMDWQDILRQEPLDAYWLSSIGRAFTSGRIGYHLQLQGPSYTLDSACSSSAAAIELACDSLRNLKCDVSLAGGVNIIASSESYIGLSRGSYLSARGSCQPFSPSADGYCRGEAVGFVVLKRLKDALNADDNILAVISGYSRTQSIGAKNIMFPEPTTQAQVYRAALADAGVQPQDIGFIETHGTGTPVGDTIEMQSISTVFGQQSDDPLVVGGLKANIGHTEASSGVCALIKAVMILRTGIIPPQPDVERGSVGLTWRSPTDRRVVIANSSTQAWHRQHDQHVLINNFDAAGGNSSFVLSQAPVKLSSKSAHPEPAWQVITCSAHSQRSLWLNMQRLRTYLSRHTPKLSDLSYTLNARRAPHKIRRSWVVSSIKELRQYLDQECASPEPKPNLRSMERRPTTKIAFAFTGQGTLYPGAGKELYSSSKTFRKAIDSYRNTCVAFGFPDILRVLIDEQLDFDALSQVELQLGLVSLELALLEMWRKYGLEPDVVVGHSLGEYAALRSAGVLSTSDTLYLVGTRASLLEQHKNDKQYAMLAVALPVSEMTNHLDRFGKSSVTVSCDNSPRACVCGGPREDIERLQTYLSSQAHKKILSKVLPLKIAFHTQAVQPILDAYEDICKQVHFEQPKLPVGSTLEARIIQDRSTFEGDYLPRQARAPVRFREALAACERFRGSSKMLWVELGPDSVCTKMIRETLATEMSDLLTSCTRTSSSLKTVGRVLSTFYSKGLKINWQAVYNDQMSQPKLLELPTYGFDQTDFWIKFAPKAALPPKALSGNPSVAPIFVRTTTLHELKSQTYEKTALTSVFATYLKDSPFRKLVQGHQVVGIPMAAMSVFIDAAVTASCHTFDILNVKVNARDLTVSKLEISRAITLSDPNAVVEISAESEPQQRYSVTVKFAVQTANGRHAVASCKVHKTDHSAKQDTAHLKECANKIAEQTKRGNGHRISKPFIYKLFQSTVQYATEFQGLQDVSVSADLTEAVGTIRLRNENPEEVFTWNPYWTDALTHLSGFLLNGLAPDEEQETLYLASELGSVSISSRPSADKEYLAYVKIKPHPHNAKHRLADLYVFHNDKVVAIAVGAKFMAVPRSIAPQILLGQDPVPAKKTPSKPHSSAEQGPDRVIETDQDGKHVADLVISAALSEVGLVEGDDVATCTFDDLGLDSIRALSVVAELKKQHDVELPASFFMQYPTPEAVRQALDPKDDSSEADSATDSSSCMTLSKSSDSDDQLQGCSTPYSSAESERQVDAFDLDQKLVKDSKEYVSDCILISGKKSSKLTPLFFMPDGSGIVATYLHFPAMKDGRCVYALESPFLEESEAFESIEQIAAHYIKTIRQYQPEGPYLVGGYSGAAMCAAEVAIQLLAAGEKILGVICIDMHGPLQYKEGFEVSREDLLKTVEEAGECLDVSRQSQRLGPKLERKIIFHLASMFKSICTYRPKQIPDEADIGFVKIFWATDGAAYPVDPEKSAVLRSKESEGEFSMTDWFTEPRTDFGLRGWERIFGDKRADCHRIESAHLSICLQPAASEVMSIIEAALNKIGL